MPPPMRSLSSTPERCIIASSIAIWLGVMNTDSSPGSLKSVCAASSVSVASAVACGPRAQRPDGEQGAADAVADRVHLLPRHEAPNLLERFQEHPAAA